MFDILTVPSVFVLWFRQRRGRPWEMVAHVGSEREAWALIGTGGRRNGDWLALPADRQP